MSSYGIQLHIILVLHSQTLLIDWLISDPFIDWLILAQIFSTTILPYKSNKEQMQDTTTINTSTETKKYRYKLKAYLCTAQNCWKESSNCIVELSQHQECYLFTLMGVQLCNIHILDWSEGLVLLTFASFVFCYYSYCWNIYGNRLQIQVTPFAPIKNWSCTMDLIRNDV